jgi:hypothetical protein
MSSALPIPDPLAMLDVGETKLAREYFRRAAVCYEAVSLWIDASTCWRECGDLAKAADALVRAGDRAAAATLLLNAGRFDDAIVLCQDWLARPGPSIEEQVTARLTVAAACTIRRDRTAAHRKTAESMYRGARAILDRPGFRGREAPRCWESLGQYGAAVGRSDLVTLGFTRALEAYGDGWPTERARVLEAYRVAAKENRTLVMALTERIRDEEAARASSGKAAPPRLEGTIEFPRLADGEGATAGEWIVWRESSKSILVTHAGRGTGIELWTDVAQILYQIGSKTYGVTSSGAPAGTAGFARRVRRRLNTAPRFVLAEGNTTIERVIMSWGKNELIFRYPLDSGEVGILAYEHDFGFSIRGKSFEVRVPEEASSGSV